MKSPFNLKALTLTLILSILFINTQTACSKDSEQRQKSVKVDFNIPLTGPLGIYGQMIRDGALMAKSDLTAQDSKIRLYFDIQDNAGKPSTAVSVMRRQLMRPADIYVSGVKPQTMAIFDQIKAKNLPHIVWVFDAFICKNNDNTLRTWVSFRYEPEKYLKYIAYKKARKLAIAYVNVPHVQEEMKSVLLPELKGRGFSEDDIFVEVFEWTEKDFKNSAAKIKEFNPDLIILSGFLPNIAGWIRALRAYDMIHDGNVIGTFDTLDVGTLLSKEELEGVRMVAPVFSIEGEGESSVQWKERFRKRYGREPFYTDAYSYDMVNIIVNAAKRLTFPATSEQWIEAIKKTDIKGVTGPLVFEDDGDLIVTLKIGVYRDGKIVLDESDK